MYASSTYVSLRVLPTAGVCEQRLGASLGLLLTPGVLCDQHLGVSYVCVQGICPKPVYAIRCMPLFRIVGLCKGIGHRRAIRLERRKKGRFGRF